MTKREYIIGGVLVALAFFWVTASSCVTADQAATKPAAGAAATQPAGAETRPAVATVTVYLTGDIHEHTAGLARIAGHVKAGKYTRYLAVARLK